MGKVKVKKQSTFIDMTAMSDVTVLLLTFFMLTSTFVQKEPITVNTPASVSEVKVPETNTVTILVDKGGKIFLAMDNPDELQRTTEMVAENYGITFTPAQKSAIRKLTSFGVPIRELPAYLDKTVEKQDAYMQEQLKTPNNPHIGIPNGSSDSIATASTAAEGTTNTIDPKNEFKVWIESATKGKAIGEVKLAIKADKTTDYKVVKKVISDLRDLRKNEYLLVTNLRTASSD